MSGMDRIGLDMIGVGHRHYWSFGAVTESGGGLSGHIAEGTCSGT